MTSHLLSFLLPQRLALAREVCSSFRDAAATAAASHARRAGLPVDWEARNRPLMPTKTTSLHLLHVLRHSGSVAQLVAQLRCPLGATAALANAKLKHISPDLISAGAEMLVTLLSHSSRQARCGALNALAKASSEVIERFAFNIEMRLQDDAEFVRLAALHALARLPSQQLARHRAALETCRDDIRNDPDLNGGFVYRAVRGALSRIEHTPGLVLLVDHL